jgi:hypothetical protein
MSSPSSPQPSEGNKVSLVTALEPIVELRLTYLCWLAEEFFHSQALAL